eukprot:2990131-Amphidinium_carterae.2
MRESSVLHFSHGQIRPEACQPSVFLAAVFSPDSSPTATSAPFLACNGQQRPAAPCHAWTWRRSRADEARHCQQMETPPPAPRESQ